MITKETLDKLRVPFSASNIKIKMQTQPKEGDTGKALCVAYIDSRDVMDRLDEVVEGDWMDFYSPGITGGVECRLTIQGVTRSDVGVSDDNEKEKSAYSDAFKRAAVKFGIGRFLYELPKMWAECSRNGKYWNLNKGEMERMQAGIQAYLSGQKPQPQQKPAATKTANTPASIPEPPVPPEPNQTGTPLRYQPVALRDRIQQTATSFVDMPFNEKQIGLLAASFNACFNGDEDKRKAVLFFLTGEPSLKATSSGDNNALLKWLAPTKGADNKYHPDPMAVREANAALDFTWREQGQQELPQ